jgi:hypothetical protein
LEPTDDSGRSEAILSLGRKLVAELGLESSSDTLGRWMAHDIAELITKAENATGEERSLIQKRCFDAILVLWTHRTAFPNGKRPFEELEPVMRAIESLDPEDSTPRYFRSAHAPKAEGEEESDAELLLNMASSLDYSAKVLIGYCLAEAANAAVGKSMEWVKLAEAAGVEDGVPEVVIHYVSSYADLEKERDPDAGVRRLLKDRMKRLDGFVEMAATLAGDIKAKLDALPPVKEGDETDDEVILSSAPQLHD